MDGVHHQEVTELAGLGAFGAHKRNIGRDIMRAMELEDIKIPKPVAMPVPIGHSSAALGFAGCVGWRPPPGGDRVGRVRCIWRP